jgi:amidophosphoribosyltransferase
VPVGLPRSTNPFDDDKLREECALFGIYGSPDAAAHTALGLHALQHRGQEATGMVSYDGQHFHQHRDLGLVGEVFDKPEVMRKLKGYAAIGHNRYSTTGDTVLRNVQPIFADFDFGGLAIAHNGNLTNAYLLRKELVRRGCLFQSTMDTEVINHLISRSNYSTVVDRLIDALSQVKGAYSLVMLTNDGLIGVRDPLGVRPLVLGKLDDAWILSSETCGLDIIGARFVRDVEPGEIVLAGKDGLKSIKPFTKAKRRFCIFEHIYFARPDSRVEGLGVYDVRKRIGMELAKESHVPADIIVPVPDSGVPAAMGYAQQAGVPFELGIIRNHISACG